MRMHLLLLATALFAIDAGAQDAPPPTGKRSLMFTADELARIVGAINDVNRPRVETRTGDDTELLKPAMPNIYVSAVADYGNGQWTVWANGVRLSPGHKVPGFQVLAVRDDLVEIIVEGDPPARVTLRPHQTWLSASNGIVEGIVP